jgi:hypothetical protein
MSGTDAALTALVRKIAKATGQSEEDVRRELDQDAAAFGDKYYAHMTPEEMALFG